MRSMVEGHPPVGAISRSCPVETLRQYNLTQRRRGAKKRLARSVIVKSYFRDDAVVTGMPQIPPPLQGRGRGWGLSALRKPIDPTPTPWSLSDQSGGLVPPRLKGRGLISQHATQQDYFGDDAPVTGIDGEIIPPRHGGAVGVAEQQRDHAKHIGGAPAGWRNLAVMPGRNAAPI
jgi:hypothetical protein